MKQECTDRFYSITKTNYCVDKHLQLDVQLLIMNLNAVIYNFNITYKNGKMSIFVSQLMNEICIILLTGISVDVLQQSLSTSFCICALHSTVCITQRRAKCTLWANTHTHVNNLEFALREQSFQVHILYYNSKNVFYCNIHFSLYTSSLIMRNIFSILLLSYIMVH